MGDNNEEKIDLRRVYDKLEDVDNKLERIKSDTHNLNRIASLSNTPLIVQELKKIIGDSTLRAAVLHLTKDEIGAGDLAQQLGIDRRNLSKFVDPFTGKRGYITVIRRGRKRHYQRSELVDLLGYESVEEFGRLIEKWKRHREKAGTATTTPSDEDVNAT